MKTIGIQVRNDDRYLNDGFGYYSPLIENIDLSSLGYKHMISLERMDNKKETDKFRCLSVIVFNKIQTFAIKLSRKVAFKKTASYLMKYSYYKALKKYKIDLLIGIQPDNELIWACKQLDIIVIDVLHGYGMRYDHNYYGGWALRRLAAKYLPNCYIALDQTSARILNYNLQEGGKAAEVYSARSPVLSYDENKPSRKRSASQDKVVVSLQWGIHRFEEKFPHNDGNLHSMILDLIINNSDIHFVIRPHPILRFQIAAMEDLKNTVAKYVNCTLSDSSLLISDLNGASFHATIWSSTVREAAMCGVPSILFSTDDYLFDNTDLFSSELRHLMAFRVNDMSSKEIINLMNSWNYSSFESYKKEVIPKYSSIEAVLSEKFAS